MSKKIINEIEEMFDEICGTPITNPKLEEHKEKIERWKVDVIAFIKEAYGMGIPEYQKDFLKQLEREINYRHSYDNHDYKCNCGTEYSITCTGRPKFNTWNSYTDQPMTMETDTWYCFRCGQPVSTYGQVLNVIAKDSAFAYNMTDERKRDLYEESMLRYNILRRKKENYDRAFRKRPKDF